MKRLMTNDLSLEELKYALKSIGDDDKKRLYVLIGVLAALLAVTAGVIFWVMKKRAQEEEFDDLEYDWDEDDTDESEDCCCSEKDLDKSVKVENFEQ